MYRKNTASQYLYFALINATNGSALTGATVTAKRSIDGGSQASATGTVGEDGNGQYHLAMSQADTNGNDIGFLFTATGAVPVSISIVTTAADPTNASTFGLTAVVVGTNNDKTGYTVASGGIGSGAHTAAELNNIADAHLDRIMSVGTDSGANDKTHRTPRQALRVLRNKTAIAGGTLTVYKEDDTTASWSGGVTTAAGDPISQVAPT